MSFHWVSREARLKIIDVLLSSRSIKQLASELGVSPTAVRKYVYRRAYPDDEVISRALSILAPYEKERVYEVLIEDILSSVKTLITMIDDPRLREKARERIVESVAGE
ncbi:hypothetical protein TCELL_1155 [Thermogladius calderae 1633]|uniref:Helix-turn-helix domain-containing protein n=1 Tax=Thermogladius calderae (strain DSM 22663 / VKM B-2946 / 1633) TaxID=1184251 RepID=I3TFP0_THEC1|nr:HTH domain-containing protein [Thermogladius calderae]AFK51578.1 hypothetical protein TCELL_1155 [Thermogladius calderae 1633]